MESWVDGHIIPIDIRLVAATNVNLEEAVRTGRFREDRATAESGAIAFCPLRKRIRQYFCHCGHFVGGITRAASRSTLRCRNHRLAGCRYSISVARQYSRVENADSSAMLVF